MVSTLARKDPPCAIGDNALAGTIRQNVVRTNVDRMEKTLEGDNLMEEFVHGNHLIAELIGADEVITRVDKESEGVVETLKSKREFSEFSSEATSVDDIF